MEAYIATNYPSAECVCSGRDFPAGHTSFCGERNQWDTRVFQQSSQLCLESLKHRLAHNGAACSPYAQLFLLLQNEEALRVIGAKSLNALLRQVPLSPREASEVKLLKRRLRKRLAKRGWDSQERTRDQSERDSLRLLGQEREKLETEKEFLIREIQALEMLLKQ